MRAYFKKLGLTLAQVSFTAPDAGECSQACGDLATKKVQNLCRAWVFSRKPGQLGGNGQCRLLTAPIEEGYYAFGVTWPINKAGSIMGTRTNEPLKVGGERVWWHWAVSRPAKVLEHPTTNRSLTAGFLLVDNTPIIGEDLLEITKSSPVVRVANSLDDCECICRLYPECGGVTYAKGEARWLVGVCHLKSRRVVDLYLIGALKSIADNKSDSSILLQELPAEPKELDATPVCSPAPSQCFPRMPTAPASTIIAVWQGAHNRRICGAGTGSLIVSEGRFWSYTVLSGYKVFQQDASRQQVHNLGAYNPAASNPKHQVGAGDRSAQSQG